jgi:hypothetical protein
MNNFKPSIESMDTPWIESPFFEQLLEESNLTKKQKEDCEFYNKNGYLIIDLKLSDYEILTIVNDTYTALNDNNTKYHADHFQYSDSKRIFEHWKKSDSIANLTVHPKIMETLGYLYGKEPFPFSTINFIKGSNQPLHSDTIHFHTIPQLWMVGVWIAFEDVNETNGTLKIVPGSHKWPVYEYHNLNLPHPDDIEDGESANYRVYEDFLVELIKSKKANEKIVNLKKGQALIWAANMLHGGCNVNGVTDLNKTRLTQANHYFFKGCDKHYHPMFSRPLEGKYSLKWCDDNNNIKTYLDNKK